MFAQRHQTAEAGLSRFVQAAPQIQFTMLPVLVVVRRSFAGTIVAIVAQLVFVAERVGIAAIARMVRLDGRRVGRDGFFDFVQFFGDRCGRVFDAAQTALK